MLWVSKQNPGCMYSSLVFNSLKSPQSKDTNFIKAYCHKA